jgi:hypothetical protein
MPLVFCINLYVAEPHHLYALQYFHYIHKARQKLAAREKYEVIFKGNIKEFLGL